MESIRAPFRGVAQDVRGRASCYKHDWLAGIRSGLGYTCILFEYLMIYFSGEFLWKIFIFVGYLLQLCTSSLHLLFLLLPLENNWVVRQVNYFYSRLLIPQLYCCLPLLVLYKDLSIWKETIFSTEIINFLELYREYENYRS